VARDKDPNIPAINNFKVQRQRKSRCEMPRKKKSLKGTGRGEGGVNTSKRGKQNHAASVKLRKHAHPLGSKGEAQKSEQGGRYEQPLSGGKKEGEKLGVRTENGETGEKEFLYEKKEEPA